MTKVKAWGQLNSSDHTVFPASTLSDINRAIARTQETGQKLLAHGLGRSYGDVALNSGGNLVMTAPMDRFQAFDAETGHLTCGAGVSLKDIQSTMVRQGWMLPVTPGTQFVTVAGAIANDVHGKNHHEAGNFGHHVVKITLQHSEKGILTLSPDENADLFKATIGGMGLTGIILSATLRLMAVKGPWLDGETIPFHGLDEFMELSQSSESDWTYTVSWIDCLSGADVRGLFIRANHAQGDGRKEPAQKSKAIPITPPLSAINGLSLRLFNQAYFHAGKNKGREIVHYIPYFYPLDAIEHWNRIYGPKGFYQYQSVVPFEGGKDAIAAMLDRIAASGDGSFLAVLKTFGNKDNLGMLSFPKPGLTLALDFPNRGERSLRLFDQLDAITREAGGRLYPAKDARQSAALFKSGYPEWEAFQEFRDPLLSSDMSRRLFGK